MSPLQCHPGFVLREGKCQDVDEVREERDQDGRNIEDCLLSFSAWPVPVREGGVSMFPGVSSAPVTPASCWTPRDWSARTRTSVCWTMEAAVSSVSTGRETESASESAQTLSDYPLNMVNTCCLNAARCIYGSGYHLLIGPTG